MCGVDRTSAGAGTRSTSGLGSPEMEIVIARADRS
jgi:hypothetical protein